MLGKIALEECWSIPESVANYNPLTLAPKGVIGGDLIANLLDVHGHRLQQMNENGVDMMVLSLSSPGAQGFVGVMLNDFQSSGPDGNAMLFYDLPQYDIFWRAAEELQAPVYIHPRAATPLIHDQMWKDRPWLEFSALGYANRVNMHVLGIITGGVLDRFPGVKLVFGHMGEHM